MKIIKTVRVQLTDDQINYAIERTKARLLITLKKKGYGTFASIHEILGMATEEYHELEEAVHNKNYKNIEDELLDLAVGCIFGYACIDAESIDW